MASAPKTTPSRAKPKTAKAAAAPRKAATRKPAAKAAPKTPAKTTAAKAPAAKPTPKAAEAQVVTKTRPEVQGPEVKRNDLIERVVARTDGKRRDVKPMVEAVLAELGAAIEKGESLNLEPFGKLKIKTEKDLAAAKVYVARLRRKKS